MCVYIHTLYTHTSVEKAFEEFAVRDAAAKLAEDELERMVSLVCLSVCLSVCCLSFVCLSDSLRLYL